MNKIELAKWLHSNYENVAKKENWNTQENCKVEFDTLPDTNKRTMIEIAERLLNFDLLRLHFVSGLLPNDEDIKKWHALLVGKGKKEMNRSIELWNGWNKLENSGLNKPLTKWQ